MKKGENLFGVIADTHENMSNISRAVEIFNEEGVDLVLHAGDFISPITADPLSELKSDLVGVFGNNDGDRLFLRKRFREEGIGEIHRDPHQMKIGNREILLMHQPKFLRVLEESDWSGIVIYGHTHRAEIKEGPPLVVNPGECGGWLTGKSSVALVDPAALEAELIKL